MQKTRSIAMDAVKSHQACTQLPSFVASSVSGVSSGVPVLYEHVTGGMCCRDEAHAAEQQPVKTELTGRQRARMADLSLLLDVILKTQAASAKQAICKSGILHQLQVKPCSIALHVLHTPRTCSIGRAPYELP